MKPELMTCFVLQIRKQQKEHAELIEEYRIKQQQCGMGPHSMPPSMSSQPPMVPGGSPPAMGQQNFPRISQQQPTPARLPSLPGWQAPSAASTHIPHSAPRAQLPVNPVTPTSVSTPSSNVQSGPPPRVEFDDNNPFSESFQERERKERLREQQERQRIQLMQEVDRQRALQQRMEMEQHGALGSELNARTSLSQRPFFSSDLQRDFMQPPQPLQQSPQHQQQPMGPVLQLGPLNSPPAASFLPCSERQPVSSSPFGPDPPLVPAGSPTFQSAKPSSRGNISGASFTQYQVRAQFATGLAATSPISGSGPPCGQETSMPHGTNFPGTSQSLIQLYSDIIPEEKGKKKRTRKKKKEDDVESVNTPSTPHSDITAPPTPIVSESVSTPTVSTPSELSRPPGEMEAEERSSTLNAVTSQSSLESKEPLSSSDSRQNRLPEPSSVNPERDKIKADASVNGQEIRQEKRDQSLSQVEAKMENQSGIKVERDIITTQPAPSSQSQTQPPTSITEAKGESGNELLKHLLKYKKSASLLNQKPDSTFHTEESAEESKVIEKRTQRESGVVSRWIFKNLDFQGTVNHTVIMNVLRGVMLHIW